MKEIFVFFSQPLLNEVVRNVAAFKLLRVSG